MIPAAAAGGETQHLRPFLVSVFDPDPPPPPPPEPVKLSVAQTGNASRVVLDTTGLWQSQGGTAPSTATAFMDGLTDAKWPQPTPAAPTVTWLVPTGVHTFTLAGGGTTYYSTTKDIYYRTYPWTPLAKTSDPNITYFGADFPKDPLAPFITFFTWYNGYSTVPDPGKSSCVFCVCPGDADFGPGDGRAEANVQDNWLPTDKPSMHLNLFGNVDSSTIFYRFDWALPQSWTAPVLVQNAQLPQEWRAGRGGGKPAAAGWQVWPNTTNINPATGDFTASQTVVNDIVRDSPSLSNWAENQGPATFKIGGGATPGGQTFTMYQPMSLGVSVSTQRFQQRAPVYDKRYCTIVEWCPDLTAMTDGAPWIVAPGVITSPRTTPWSNTNSIAPYGVPPGTPGGGYFRVWESLDTGVTWTCVTAGTSFAVPGTATINTDGTISGGDAGKIFGPTIKCNGAKLASAITAGQTPPFTVTVSNVVAGAGFNQGGVLSDKPHLWIGNERFRYSSYNGTAKTLTISARGDRGTAKVAHSIGEDVAGPADYPMLSVGMNTSAASLAIPLACRQWPIIFGRSFAAVANVHDV